MKKAISVLSVSAILIIAFAFTAFAEWKQDAKGWWWVNTDGSYSINQWIWVDSNNDGVAECYYCDGQGYILRNTTTPDGYQVNNDGQWVVNGVVQTKSVASSSSTTGEETLKALAKGLTSPSLGISAYANGHTMIMTYNTNGPKVSKSYLSAKIEQYAEDNSDSFEKQAADLSQLCGFPVTLKVKFTYNNNYIKTYTFE